MRNLNKRFHKFYSELVKIADNKKCNGVRVEISNVESPLRCAFGCKDISSLFSYRSVDNKCFCEIESTVSGCVRGEVEAKEFILYQTTHGEYIISWATHLKFI